MGKDNELEFFDRPTEASLTKIEIISKYFEAWSNVMKGTAKAAKQPAHPRFAFVDLYCGPGQYLDGTPSTPLKVVTHAARDKKLRDELCFIFNDRKKDYISQLDLAIKSLMVELPEREGSSAATVAALDLLSHKPKIFRKAVGPWIEAELNALGNIPILSLLDPFGIKGLSGALIKRLISGWGSDCIFFFNYRRINLSLKNPAYSVHLDELFGHERMKNLKKLTEGLDAEFEPNLAEARENAIIESLQESVKSLGGKFVYPFGFRSVTGKGLLHCIVLASKDIKAEKIWKDILAGQSVDTIEGIPNHHHRKITQYGLALGTPDLSIKVLKQEILDLLEDYRMPITFTYLQNIHSPGKQYVTKNYRVAILELEKEGHLTILRDLPSERIDITTLGPDYRISITRTR
jgi:three-Cys-motif partner protein